MTKVSYAATRLGEGERTTKVLSSLRVKSRSNYEHLATSAFTGRLNTPRCTRILYRRECTCVAPARETHKSLSVGLRRSNTESLKPCNFVELRIAPHHRGRHLMAAMRTEPAPSACTAVPSTHNFATHCSPLYGESSQFAQVTNEPRYCITLGESCRFYDHPFSALQFEVRFFITGQETRARNPRDARNFRYTVS